MLNKKFEIFSIIFSIVLGTLLHFTFELSNNNLFVASFSAVNESTWEHLKLIFFPMLFVAIIGYCFYYNNINNYLFSKLLGILASLLFITIFFYTYTGILGFNITFLDISSFFVAIFLGEYVFYKSFQNSYMSNKKIAITLLVVLLFCFIIFTFFPPNIGYFKDPITGLYGIITK